MGWRDGGRQDRHLPPLYSVHCTLYNVQSVYNNNRPRKLILNPGPATLTLSSLPRCQSSSMFKQIFLGYTLFTSFLLMNFSFMLSTVSWSIGQNIGAEVFLFCLKGMSRSPSTRETDRRRAERRDLRDL